jgi:hypothetical protein
VRYTKLWGLAVLFVLFYTKIWFIVPGFSSRHFFTALFFFSLGGYFSIFAKNMVIALRKYQNVWYALAFVTLILGVYFFDDEIRKYFHPIYVLAGTISAINVTSYFMERGKLRMNETFSQSSFFIYCAHGILVVQYAQIAFRAAFAGILDPNGGAYITLSYFVLPFFCVAFLIGVFVLMKRLMPKVLNLFIGSR